MIMLILEKPGEEVFWDKNLNTFKMLNKELLILKLLKRLDFDLSLKLFIIHFFIKLNMWEIELVYGW